MRTAVFFCVGLRECRDVERSSLVVRGLDSALLWVASFASLSSAAPPRSTMSRAVQVLPGRGTSLTPFRTPKGPRRSRTRSAWRSFPALAGAPSPEPGKRDLVIQAAQSSSTRTAAGKSTFDVPTLGLPRRPSPRCRCRSPASTLSIRPSVAQDCVADPFCEQSRTGRAGQST